jgi:hypothetical protein
MAAAINALKLKPANPLAFRRLSKELHDAADEYHRWSHSVPAEVRLNVPPDFEKHMPKLRELIARDPRLSEYSFPELWAVPELVELASISKRKSGRRTSETAAQRIKLFARLANAAISQRRMAPNLYPDLPLDKAYERTRIFKNRHSDAIEAEKLALKSAKD